jgi:protease I
MADLTGKKIAFIVYDAFEQIEYTSPRDALQEAGAETVLLSPNEGEVQGLNHIEKADTFTVDALLKDADPDEFDALVVPGGAVNADHLRMDDSARRWLGDFLEADKPTAVICHGPWLIVSSGEAPGRRLTSYYTIQDDIKNAGGDWVDETVVVDGTLITSRNPDDLPAFNKALLDMLTGTDENADD